MHLIAISRLREAAARYPDVAIQIEDWNEIVKIATWQNLTEVQQTYASAEAVGNFTVFNIKGNRYRLIVTTWQVTKKEKSNRPILVTHLFV
jgi:mRNA interferase HigB